MHRFLSLLLVSLVIFLPAKSQIPPKAKKVLFVIVDGISADSKEKVNTPFLDEIAKVGGYAHAHVGGDKGTYNQTPTISAVGYNSLLTGTWVNKHNVWGNDIKEPNYRYWSIFRFMEAQYPQKQTAIFSTWLDNRTKLIGTGLPETNHLQLDYYFDGFELDTLQFPHDKQAEYIHKIDELVTNEAATYLRHQAPDLSWVYLEFTDDMGHRYGDSEQFHEAIKVMDTQIGRLWEAIKYREKNFKEEWQLYVTTDHGRDANTGKGHGGQSDRERGTWIVTNAKGLNEQFSNNPGIVDIMPTMARHLGITIPKEQAFEVDGIPFTGQLSIHSMAVTRDGKALRVSWKAVEKKGKVKVWVATTNHFKEGVNDRYLLIDQVEAGQEKVTIDISRLPSKFYKIVLEGEFNTTNKWVVE